MHSCEDKVDRVGDGSSEEATSETCHDVVVGAGRASRIRVQLVVEEEETPDSGSRVRHSLREEAVPASVELSHASARSMDLIEDVRWGETSLETDSSKDLALLEHLRSSLHQVKRLCL